MKIVLSDNDGGREATISTKQGEQGTETLVECFGKDTVLVLATAIAYLSRLQYDAIHVLADKARQAE